MCAPLISVLMGVYYHNEDIAILKRSINSILQQTYSQIEFLICDDGSSEKVKYYLESKAKKDDRIVLVRPGQAFSLATKLNHCLKEARGNYIGRMDDDDFSHLDRFEKEIAVLLENEKISFVGCNVSLYQKGNSIGCWKLPPYPKIQDFLIRQPFVHPTLLFRKEVLLEINGYSEEKECILCEDYDLFLRLYEMGYQGANLQEILFDYTIPLAAKGKRKMVHRWNETVVRWRHFKDLGLLPGALLYVIKPLLVGMVPDPILKKIKKSFYQAG